MDSLPDLTQAGDILTGLKKYSFAELCSKPTEFQDDAEAIQLNPFAKFHKER